MSKRLTAFFIALAIVLTSSSVWNMTVYAVVYPPQTKQPTVSANTTVGDVWTYNYTRGMELYANFTNNGTVNVSGGSFNINSFNINSAYTAENNGTFTFTGTNNTFSLGSSGTFVNNGTATITNVYNFCSPNGSSFINNGTLYLENISSINLEGFTNYGVIIFPDEAKNGSDPYVYNQFESKCQDGGQVYTQTEWTNRKLNYPINYEGLSAGGYWDYENPNPTYYEWAAADPQDVTLADPVLPGYEFLGWTGFDVTEPAKNFTFSSSVCEEVTVTAHWKPVVYTISYELDGGSFSVGNTPSTEYSRGGQPGLTAPYKTGYTFAGWIDTDTNEQVSTGDTVYYLPPSTLGDKTYKASFIANTDTQYKVVCYYQNIDGTYEEEKYLLAGETDAQVSVVSGSYVKEGFTFDSDNSGNVLSGTIKADNSLELKLYFDRSKYTVTYKSQDGSKTLWTTEKYFNETVGEYGGGIPAKTSDDNLYTYVFDNWARDESGRDFGYEVSDIVVSEDITFYAAFKKVRDESIVVITWEEYDGFNAPAQTEIRLEKGADYTAELRLINENYYVGTREWHIGFQEAHIYWYDTQNGEQGIEYTVDKENFEAPVTLTISNVQHDTFIRIKAHYHDEHDYSAAYDEIIQNGNCTADSVIRHFCYKCGKTYDETVSAGGHVTGSAFEKDKISHWKTCDICGEEIGLEAHTPDEGTITYEPTHHSTGTKTYTCTVCGYVTGREVLSMIPHTPEGDWQSNAKAHYKTCSCGAILEETPHTPDEGTVTLEPTYDTEGKTEYRCRVCGYLLGKTAIAPLGHNVDEQWQSEVSGHWHNCECGKRHNFGGHISDGGLVTVEPTYEEWGERVFSCAVCGYVLSVETLPPLSHKTDGEWVSDEENHWKEGCGCGGKHELGAHIPDSGTVTLYPTETEEGQMEYRCAVCKYVIKTEVIPALGGGSEAPSEPTEPSDPTEPTEPSDPTEPTEPTEPSDPTDPSGPSKPTELPKPAKPTEPVISDKPVIPSHPDNGIPFLKNENEKNGWIAIKAEAEMAAEGGAITVDMNGTTVVPGFIIDTITGRDVTLVFDMGGDISWSVNGKSVSVENVGDIDFSVKKNTDEIPIDVVNKLTGKRHGIQISLAHDGEFGFTAVLSINLGSENSGLYAALYFYNDGGLELIDESVIAQDGTVRMTFRHASDYLVVIGEKADNDVEKPDNGNETDESGQPETDDKSTTPSEPDEDDAEDNNPETGEAGKFWKIILLGSILTAAVASAFYLIRKKYKAK